MAKKLYVGGLSYDTNEASLQEYFSQYGAVEKATIIMDKMTGRSRGFGFVEMADDAGAEKAVAEANGKEFEGRTLTVNEARPMTDRPAGGGFRRGGNGGGFGGGRGGFGGGRRDSY